ncbi:MAG: CSLREA domain-containing protein [Verrucomicrobiae bacterium]|jgi:CSLREA domain-containing protein|nr:CSLREA domain-containing protein [Solirubrobacterales bacterium]MCB1127899.1 CSLREA domain-containing protein [Verrucomicrobiae bacterium]
MKAFLAGAIALIAVLLVPAAANAVTINVNTTVDEYGTGTNCSLREAITAAQTNSSFGGCPAGFASDEILLPGGDYLITRAGAEEDTNATGDFDVTGTNPLEIRAAGPNDRVIIDGNDLDRIFHKTSTGDLKLTALRVTNGKLTAIEDGGGVLAGVGLTSLEDVTVDNSESAIGGGGIANYAQLLLVNSTVSSNSADGNGGGLYLTGGTSTTVRSSTIFANKADANDDGNGYGGGLADTGGSVSFTNVLNASNTGTATLPANDANDCYSGPSFFPRFSLQTQAFGPLDCLVGFNPGTNVLAGNPGVDPILSYNGGQTPTHALLPGSPAIGAGGVNPPDECPGVDQNGYGRPAGQCDIGAVQFKPEPKLKITAVKPGKKVIKRGKARVITLVVRNSGTGPANATKACLVLTKAARKGLRVKGKTCRNLGKVGVSATKRAKIKLVAKGSARKKAYTVKATAKATGTAKVTRSFKVRVR